MNLEKLKREISGLDFIQSGFILHPLQGGAINQSFRLQSGQQQYFVKTFASEVFTGLDRAERFTMQQQVGKLAPKPLYLSEQQDFQIEQWRPGQTLDQAIPDVPKQISILADTLCQIHRLAVRTTTLDLPSHWRCYLQVCLQQPEVLIKHKLDSTKVEQTIAEYQAYWKQVDKTTFCHHDLALAHVAVDNRLWVYDWEYAALSNAEFDLAACILVNGLELQTGKQLVEHYAEQMDKFSVPLWRQVQDMMPLVELTSRLWYCAADVSLPVKPNHAEETSDGHKSYCSGKTYPAKS